jgi:uncharacterized MAPEG superfamily protein
MTVELWMLVATTGVLFGLTLVQSAANVIDGVPVRTVIGNRDDMPPLTGLRGRSYRAVINLLEGMAIFAPLIIVAHLAGVSNTLTVGGATLYFLARAAHATIYVLGIPLLRTLAFLVGMAGLGMIVLALIGFDGPAEPFI